MINASIAQLADDLKNKKISSKELVQFYLDRIDKYDGEIQAYNHVNENAVKQAEQIDNDRISGKKMPKFAGVPIALKDLLITKDMPTTCGSKILENFRPPFTGTAVKLIEDAGFVTLGKLSMDEFAMGSSNENAAFKKTRNPWDTERVPGGSSGGSANPL